MENKIWCEEYKDYYGNSDPKYGGKLTDLLTKYTKFLRYPNPEYDNEVYGRFGCTFKEWSEENFGCEYVEEEE